MTSQSPTTRLVRIVLIAGLAALVVGLPLVGLRSGGRTTTILMSEGEEATDGESGGEWNFSDLFASFVDFDAYTAPTNADRIADDLVETESALPGTHLQRAPPLG